MAKKLINGNYAAAFGAKLARAEVIAAYPITPQTAVVEQVADFVASGEMKARYVCVESEHSAMAACIAAASAGARTFTATSSQGLLLMHELLHWATGARTPVVMVNVNRAVAPPWSVWADQTDSISQRDTGWMQFYSESTQEELDTVIMSYKVGESPDIMLPSFTTEDAFFLSHTFEPVEIPSQELVDGFLPPFRPEIRLDVENPRGFGSLSMPHQWYMELRYLIAEAMDRARERILRVEQEWKELTGRSYGGPLDEYRTEDADVVLMNAGTAASTIREVVDNLRREGKRVGLARIRCFRPFPTEEIRALGRRVHTIGVMDRCYTFGDGGPFFTEVKSALYNLKDRPAVKNFVVGIGGRDITMKTVGKLYDNLFRIKAGGLDSEKEWIDLKRPEVG
ncbi:MAG: pyruvate ferredoxin oxidoreductase [Euryarchaeota archaeon]|nr:pyruvate ferredoxin oxidoreductase [Euryarchaeota archaeon]